MKDIKQVLRALVDHIATDVGGQSAAFQAILDAWLDLQTSDADTVAANRLIKQALRMSYQAGYEAGCDIFTGEVA
jgi:hypothetical protein